MSNELTVHKPAAGGFEVATWVFDHAAPMFKVAEQFALSGLVPQALKGKPADCFTVLMTGVELGLGPATSLRAIHVVQGRAVLSADIMAGLAMKAGASFEYIQNDATACTIKWTRGKSTGTCTFTMADAERAKLSGKETWRAYPAAMLAARCRAIASRQAAPDLLAGLYDPDEIESTHAGAAETPSARPANNAATVPPPAAVPAPTTDDPPPPSDDDRRLEVEVEAVQKPAPKPRAAKPRPPTAEESAAAVELSAEETTRIKKHLWAVVTEMGIDGKRDVDGEMASVIYSCAIKSGEAVDDAEIMLAFGLLGHQVETLANGCHYVTPRKMSIPQMSALADRLQTIRNRRQSVTDVSDIFEGVK